MAKPIFIVGKNRSGTKWLSNILLNHPNIAGIQSDYHRGILETNMFQNMPIIFGNLKDIDNFIGVTEPYEESDNPELIINTASLNVDECEQILFKKVIESLTEDDKKS